MAEEGPPSPAGATPEGARLRALDDELKRARGDDGAFFDWQKNIERPPGPALGLALRVAVELVSALAVGFGIGWLLDRWLATRPWLMLVFMLLGGAAGILNVYRLARGFGYAAGYRKDAAEPEGKAGGDGKGSSGG